MEANLRMLADVSAARAQREIEERQGFGDKAGVREYLATMHHRQHGLRRLDPRLDQQATGSREEPVMFTDSSEEEEEEEMGQVNGGSWMTRTPRGPPPGLVQYSTYWSMAGGSNTGNDNLGTNIRRATAGGQLRVNCGIEGCPVCVSGSQF
jgi:hypothetical protein